MSSEQRVSWWRGTSLGEERGLEGERGRLSGALPPPSVSLSLRPLSPCPFAGCELNQERPTWTFKPQKVGKQDCVLLLSTVGTALLRRGERVGQGGTWPDKQEQVALPGPHTWSQASLLRPRPGGEDAPCPFFQPPQISLGEKAKEEVNVVEILPSASQEDKKRRPLILASLRASVLPMVSFPEGLGNPGSSPRRPCSGLSPCVQTDTKVVYRLLQTCGWCPREIFFVV